MLPERAMSELQKLANEKQSNEALRIAIKRIDALEQRVAALETRKYVDKKKKDITRVGSYLPYIDKILANGRIWSTYAIEEQMREIFPDIPPFTHAGLQTACSTLANKGKIAKVGYGNYRKKE